VSSNLSVWAERYIVPPAVNIDSRPEPSFLTFNGQTADSIEEFASVLLTAVACFAGQAEVFAVLLKGDQFFSINLCGDILQMDRAVLTIGPADAVLYRQAGLRLCINAKLPAGLQDVELTHPQLTFIQHEDSKGQLFYTADYSASQLQQLLNLWLAPQLGQLIRGPQAAPPEVSLYRRFVDQAERHPEAVALQMGAVILSWSELAQRVECTAMFLATTVPRHGCVALALPKSIELVVATLACNAAGVVAMPLIDDIPLERLRYQLFDANSQYVLGQLSYVLEGVTQLSLPVSAPSQTVLLRPLAIDEVNTLYYTSGSEGKPKGVMLPGRALHRLVVEADFFDVQPQDRFGYFSNPAFDASALEVWAAMLNGLPLVLFERETLLDLHQLERQIVATKVNSGFFTTGLFNRIADLNPALFCHFRQLFFGGEKASVQALRAALAASPNTRFINGYGPTENGVYTCCQRVDSAHVERFDIAIGHPIVGTDIVLVDSELEPVSIGATGQLLCLGEGLASGYINQPQRSAERFVQWRNRPAYLSGDLARLNEQGAVEFIGRMDAQIKLNGYRIEPGEIEALLRRQPDVQRAYVRLDEQSCQLQAWLTPLQADTAAARFVCRQLPAWMRPVSFMTLAELPLNANGKIDHHHLRQLAQQQTAAVVDTVVSITSLQQRLLHLYSDILQQPVHDLDASLFELGGNSLHMMSLLARLRKEWQLQINLDVLAGASSPGQVSQLIELLGWHERDQSDKNSLQVWEF